MNDERIVALFLDAVCDSGTPVATCDFCGKTWFAADGEFMEEGELDRLLAKMQATPEKYGTTSDSSVSYGCAFGRQFVFYCHCEKASKLALTVWQHRSLTLRFITSVSEEMKREVATLEAELQKV